MSLSTYFDLENCYWSRLTYNSLIFWFKEASSYPKAFSVVVVLIFKFLTFFSKVLTWSSLFVTDSLNLSISYFIFFCALSSLLPWPSFCSFTLASYFSSYFSLTDTSSFLFRIFSFTSLREAIWLFASWSFALSSFSISPYLKIVAAFASISFDFFSTYFSNLSICALNDLLSPALLLLISFISFLAWANSCFVSLECWVCSSNLLFNSSSWASNFSIFWHNFCSWDELFLSNSFLFFSKLYSTILIFSFKALFLFIYSFSFLPIYSTSLFSSSLADSNYAKLSVRLLFESCYLFKVD